MTGRLLWTRMFGVGLTFSSHLGASVVLVGAPPLGGYLGVGLFVAVSVLMTLNHRKHSDA